MVMGTGITANNNSGEGLVGSGRSARRLTDEEMGQPQPPRRLPMERSVTMGSDMEEWMRDDDDDKLRECPGFKVASNADDS